MRRRFLVLLTTAATLAACTTELAYRPQTPDGRTIEMQQAQSVAGTGWDMRDTLDYSLPRLHGKYDCVVTVRTGGDYPYRDLTFLAQLCDEKRHISHSRILTVPIYNDADNSLGHGIPFAEHDIAINDLQLDSAHTYTLRLAHRMRKECLPGIPDVSIRLMQAQ